VTLANAPDIATVSELEIEQYGDESIGADRLTAWWNTYKSGIHLLVHDGTIHGIVGVWPLTRTAFLRLQQDGTEDSITSQSLQRGPIQNHEWWYIGDVYLVEPLRAKSLGNNWHLDFLTYHVLRSWITERPEEIGDRTIQIAGVILTPHGQGLARRFDFTRHGDSSIWIKTTSRARIAERMRELEQHWHEKGPGRAGPAARWARPTRIVLAALLLAATAATPKMLDGQAAQWVQAHASGFQCVCCYALCAVFTAALIGFANRKNGLLLAGLLLTSIVAMLTMMN